MSVLRPHWAPPKCVRGLFGRKTYRLDVLEELENNKKQGHYTEQEALENENRIECEEDEANLVSSLMVGQGKEITDPSSWHMPVLDLDLPCQLIPSSTPGHFHLYIDKPMTWVRYKNFLAALRDAGIIEDGFYKLSLTRGATFVRHPDCKKGVGRSPRMVVQSMVVNIPQPETDDCAE